MWGVGCGVWGNLALLLDVVIEVVDLLVERVDFEDLPLHLLTLRIQLDLGLFGLGDGLHPLRARHQLLRNLHLERGEELSGWVPTPQAGKLARSALADCEHPRS